MLRKMFIKHSFKRGTEGGLRGTEGGLVRDLGDVHSLSHKPDDLYVHGSPLPKGYREGWRGARGEDESSFVVC